MRKVLIVLCVLLLAGCTAKEVIVTKAVNLSLKIEEVKGTKVIFTITSDNPDAYYSYTLWHDPNTSDALLLEYLTDVAEQDYTIKTENGAVQVASFADLNAFRGSRTLRATRLTPDTDYKVLVFQINPTTHEPIGKILSEVIHTKAVKNTPMKFDFFFEGKTVTVVPSDPARTYYWEYNNLRLMYDNFNWSYGWYYSLVDMYEQYGFMGNLLSKGKVVYDASRDHFEEGEVYSAIAAAYEGGEQTSDYVECLFKYENGKLVFIGYEGAEE
jgi:hypothetical protein